MNYKCFCMFLKSSLTYKVLQQTNPRCYESVFAGIPLLLWTSDFIKPGKVTTLTHSSFNFRRQQSFFLKMPSRIHDVKLCRNNFLMRTNDDRVFRTGQFHTVFNKLNSCSKKSIGDANKNNRLNTQKNIKRLQRAALCSAVFTLIRLWQTYYVSILQNPVFRSFLLCVCLVGTGCSASLCSLAATYHWFWQCVDELPQGSISFLLGLHLLNSWRHFFSLTPPNQ